MTAGEIRALAVRAGVGPGVSVLDVCCGVGRARAPRSRASWAATTWAWTPARAPSRSPASGPAGCRAASRSRRSRRCRAGAFDVVLLLETMLAFEDKDALVQRDRRRRSAPGGRFAFTLEEGPPLTAPSGRRCPTPTRSGSPRSTSWAASLERAGLAVTWQEDHSARAPRDGAGRSRPRTRRTARRSPRGRPPRAGRPARRAPAVDRVDGGGDGSGSSRSSRSASRGDGGRGRPRELPGAWPVARRDPSPSRRRAPGRARREVRADHREDRWRLVHVAHAFSRSLSCSKGTAPARHW